MTATRDVVVVGAGIVGLATAFALLRQRPGVRLAVVDKESRPGAHQSGHNSGVIHSGIYYRPGSFKARFCVEGARRMVAFCQEHGIQHRIAGKVVVATRPEEIPALEELHRRAVANGVPNVRRVGRDELRELEPLADGISALHVPGTGTVDYRQVVSALARVVQDEGGEMLLDRTVLGARERDRVLHLDTTAGSIVTRYVINCAGLHADRVARNLGAEPGVRIVPFRGEYYTLHPRKAEGVRGAIYPVPDPRFPFLGVHFTKGVDGRVEAGPNAVLAFAREGYTRWRVRPDELCETLIYRGFWAMTKRYWRTGAGEFHRSLSKAAFAQALRHLMPSLEESDLAPGGAGVRAQAVDPTGALLDDFRIVRTAAAIHVLNAPSPAATASLVIGEHIAELLQAN